MARTKKTQTSAKAAIETIVPATQQATEQVVETPKAPKAEKPVETPEQALARLKRENAARFAHVVSIAAMGKTGPTRVVIECDDPQTKLGTPVCTKTREIAVQDLFQVHRCAACQDRVVRRARREKAKARVKALKAMARAAKAS